MAGRERVLTVWVSQDGADLVVVTDDGTRLRVDDLSHADSPLLVVAAATAVMEWAEQLRRTAARRAHDRGIPLAAIGEAGGVSRQAAAKWVQPGADRSLPREQWPDPLRASDRVARVDVAVTEYFPIAVRLREPDVLWLYQPVTDAWWSDGAARTTAELATELGGSDTAALLGDWCAQVQVAVVEHRADTARRAAKRKETLAARGRRPGVKAHR